MIVLIRLRGPLGPRAPSTMLPLVLLEGFGREGVGGSGETAVPSPFEIFIRANGTGTKVVLKTIQTLAGQSEGSPKCCKNWYETSPKVVRR